MRPTYPNLSNVTAGQVLGAEQLKSYNRALEYLYAEAHAPLALGGAMLSENPDDSPSDTPHTAWTGYTRHAGNALQYCFQTGENSDDAGQEYHVIYQYYGDDSVWHTVGTALHGEGSAILSGAVDITGATMTVGNIYEWHAQVYGNDEGTHSADNYNVSYEHWWLAEYNTVPSASWKTPKTFVAGGTSAAADFNDWHTDMDLLEATIPDMNWLTGNFTVAENSDTDWHPVFRGAYPYRPDQLYLGLQAQLTSGDFWQWRAAITDTANTAVIFWTSGTIAGTSARDWQTTTIDISPDSAAGSIIAAGSITLTLGSYYRVRLDTKKLDGDAEVLYAYTAYMMRLSDGTPTQGGASDMIPNGGFESFTGVQDNGTTDAFASWDIALGVGGAIIESTATSHAGTSAVKLTAGSLPAYIATTLSPAPSASTHYDLTYWTKGTVCLRHSFYNDSAGFVIGQTNSIVGGTAYTQGTIAIDMPAGATGDSYVYFYPPATAGNIAYLDDVSLPRVANTWQTLPTWAHGDIDIGPTKLNKVSNNLPVLNTHGIEQLFGSNLISPAYEEGSSERTHTGAHRKRWLHYLPLDGTVEPTVHYGDRSDTQTLTAGTTWTSIDTEEFDNFAYGMYYDLKNARCAFEADD